MDEKLELLINTLNKLTKEYAYKIYVKNNNEEQEEYYYDVFFHPKINEPVPKYTIKATFVITKLNIIDFNESEILDNEKYFIHFQFENETLKRTLDMNLNFDKWIDKLIKDKKSLRNKIDLSSDYMKTRFIKPLHENDVQKILNKIKDEREQNRIKQTTENNENKNLNKQKYLTNNLKDKHLEKDLIKYSNDDKLNEILIFLKNLLYSYFTNIDIKKKGKVKYKKYLEIMKMVNYEMYFSFNCSEIYSENNEKEIHEESDNNIEKKNKESFDKFYFDETSTDISSSNDSFDEISIENEQINKLNKTKETDIANIFNINNQDINLIKDSNIYKNGHFYGYNIFFENVDTIYNKKNSTFIFNKDNPYNKYTFTNNYYDFILYIAFADEDEDGYIKYKELVNYLPIYLYNLKKNRELHIPLQLNDLLLYKQLLYVCYQNEINFMNKNLLKYFNIYDINNSGYIHRNKFKKILKQNYHLISNIEYKLLLQIINFNDDNYVYYKNINEIILCLRFEAIKNNIFEKDETLLHKYLCEEIIRHNIKNKKTIHIFDCKNVLEYSDKIYLNKNTIHIILSLLDINENLEVDINNFLKISITIITNMIKLSNLQMIYNVIMNEKEKNEKNENNDSPNLYKKNKNNKIEKINVPALDLVERTLTKLFKVLNEKNENFIYIIDFIKTLQESNENKKKIDIKEICKFSKGELQGIMAEINTPCTKNIYQKNAKTKNNLSISKNTKIDYASHIKKWCSKTYQIGSCYYFSYFMNYSEPLIELDNDITNSILFCENDDDNDEEKKKEITI